MHIGNLFIPGEGSFLVLSAAWHAGGPPARYTQVRAPAGLRDVRPGRSKSWRTCSFCGIAFRQSQAGGPWKPHSFKTNEKKTHHCFALLLLLKYRTRPQRLGSQGATAAALQAFPFVRATNGASACVRVRGCMRVCMSHYWILSSRNQEQSER